MRLKRAAATAAALLALTAGVALAASWETGDYKGRTEGKFKGADGKLRKGKISFTVKKQSVAQIVYEIRTYCAATGAHTSFRVSHGGSLPLSPAGHFSGSAPSAGGTGRDRIAGTVSGSTATGTVRSYDREDRHGREDPNGVKCDSGKVGWTAHRKAP